MADFISAAHDVAFKALFVNNRDLLRAFLSDVLELPLSEEDKVEVLNPELTPDIAIGKLSRIDIHVETKELKINVEMQARKDGFSAERVLYYWSKLFSDDVESGDEYKGLKRTFSVNVLGFNALECKEYHSSFSIREDKRSDRLTDKLSIHIFELTKVPKELIDNDNMQLWMQLIGADSEEALRMVEMSSQNPMIQKGVKAVRSMNADPVLREQIRQREKALRDYRNDLACARSEGVAEGRTQMALELLAGLVKEGYLSIPDAAKRAGMSVSEFQTKAGLTD